MTARSAQPVAQDAATLDGDLPDRARPLGALHSTTIRLNPMRNILRGPHTPAALLALVVLGGCASAPHTRADASTRFPAPVAAAWASAGRTAAGSAAPDTALWVLLPNGRVEHREVRLRMRNGVPTRTERLQLTASWWREARRDDAGADTSWVICTSQRPSRNRQCGRVSVDTVTGGRRRLRWDGVTFGSQHWLFTER